MALVDFSIRSRAVPDAEVVAAADTLFKAVEYPVLMHCKSGADRAGMMAALYMLLQEGADARKAAEQLSLKYLHVVRPRQVCSMPLSLPLPKLRHGG